MAKKATHRGHCQCCGRVQKLPGNLLSKHGYTVDWGYFNGVCWGAHHRPLEEDRTIMDQSCARIREQVKWARENDPKKVRCSVAVQESYVGRGRGCRKVRKGGEVDFNDFEAFRVLAFENKNRWRTWGWKEGHDYLAWDDDMGRNAHAKYGTVEEQEEREVVEQYAAARKQAIQRQLANAAQAERHADWLEEFANEVHGKPLQEIKD
jgi:hypothetical protein